jgi:hypothetical protein
MRRVRLVAAAAILFTSLTSVSARDDLILLGAGPGNAGGGTCSTGGLDYSKSGCNLPFTVQVRYP